MNQNGQTSGQIVMGIFVGVLVLGIAIAIAMWGIPQYRVYDATQHGKAALQRANQEREILVTQARAELEAAELRAQAIAIVGAKAKEFPEYRQQEFIGAFAEAIKEGDVKLIFVPTEANIPILQSIQP